MSRRNSRRRQQAMNARSRAASWARRANKWVRAEFLRTGLFPPAPKLRVIHADPDTFPWFRGFGASPVFRRMDGSAIGPVEVASASHANGSSWVQWEVVEVRPGEPEVVATLIPEAEWRAGS
jgi:hypothetical protein